MVLTPLAPEVKPPEIRDEGKHLLGDYPSRNEKEERQLRKIEEKGFHHPLVNHSPASHPQIGAANSSRLLPDCLYSSVDQKRTLSAYHFYYGGGVLAQSVGGRSGSSFQLFQRTLRTSGRSVRS